MQTAVNGGSELLICVPGAVHGLSATPTVPSCLSLAGVLQHSTPTHAAWRPPANLADFQQRCDRVHLDRHRVPFTPEPDVGQIAPAFCILVRDQLRYPRAARGHWGCRRTRRA